MTMPHCMRDAEDVAMLRPDPAGDIAEPAGNGHFISKIV
jgi:hypothetical protein